MSRPRGPTWVMSRSQRRIEPSFTASRPAIIRKRVVLPQPDGPTSTMNSPLSIVRLIPSTAVTPPGKVLRTPLKTIVLTAPVLLLALECHEGRRLRVGRAPSDERVAGLRIEEVTEVGIEREPDRARDRRARRRRQARGEDRASVLGHQAGVVLAFLHAHEIVGLDRGNVEREEDEDLGTEVLDDGHAGLDRPRGGL